MENSELAGVSEHQFTLDSFTTDSDHHVGKFGSGGSTSLMENVTVSVADSEIYTGGLVASLSGANDAPLTSVSATAGAGHVTLSDISSNLRRMPNGPGNLLMGIVISPESLRAVTNIFQTLPASLEQQRPLASSSVSSVIADAIAADDVADDDGSSHNASVGINLMAGSLGALSEKEIGRTCSVSEQSALGMEILQGTENPLSAITSGSNVVFTTSCNTATLVSNSALGPGGDSVTIDIGQTLQGVQADVNASVAANVPSSSLLDSESQMMVGSVDPVDPNEAQPMYLRVTSEELARLAQTVENVSNDVGDLEASTVPSQTVSLIHVDGVPGMELSSTGELVIPEGSVVYTQDGENLITMPQGDVEDTATIPVQITQPMAALEELQLIKEESPPKIEKKKGKGGWPKGKKRKKTAIEMAKAPKPTTTAYGLFVSENLAEVKASHPELVKGANVCAFLGKMWNGLPSAEKQKFVERAREDKEHYLREIKEYQETSSCQVLLKRQAKGVLDQLIGTDGDITEQINNLNKNDLLGCDQLHCKVCGIYFSSNHNMSQHVLGKQHMMALAAKICEMNKETLGLKELEGAALGETNKASTSSDCHSCECFKTGMPHTEGFRSTFMELHYERELELRDLRQQHTQSIRDQINLKRQIKELQDMLSKSEGDQKNLKEIGTNLQAQLNSLYRIILFLSIGRS